MILQSLVNNAAGSGDAVAIIDDSGSYTHRQLAAAAGGLGRLISMRTDRPHVGLCLPSSFTFAASFYGTLLAGKSVTPINFLLGQREIAHVIKDSGIDTVVTAPPLAAKMQPTGLKIIDLSALAGMSPGTDLPTLPPTSPDDLAVLLYTSGTVGMPKGVMLTYGNLQSDVEAAIEHAQLRGAHKFLGIIPLFHSTGMLATLIAPAVLGSTVIYQARFSPLGALKAIRQHGISVVVAVPSMYGAMIRLKEGGPEDLKTIYAVISGGEPLPANIREGFERKFNVPVLEGYGLTETIGPVSFNTPQQHRPGSVGRPIPGVQLKIVDDQGESLPVGQRGEVWVRGPMITRGYYNLPQVNQQAITSDGYFKTGDLGHLDGDGYLHITGRKKDLIIVAGEKVSPREIEERLMAHETVQEAVVLGRKDPSRGEVVVAFVLPRPGRQVNADQIREYCRQAGMAQWQIPREIFLVADFPRSPTGKLLKRVLAERLNEPAAG